MSLPAKSAAELLQENVDLRARLEEAEETLRAIRSGEVDALVMGEEVYTLKGAETPYRILIEQMYEGAGTVLDDGTVLYANRRLSELLRTPLQELIGTSLRRFVAPPERPTFDKLMTEGKQSSGKGEFVLQRQDGSALSAQLSFSVVYEQDARPICVVVTDLSERKRAEEVLRQAHDSLEQRVRKRTEELQQHRDFLECLIASAGSCIAVLKGRELRCTLANPAFRAVAAGAPMVGRTYREVFPEGAAAGAEARLHRVLDTGEPWIVQDYRAPIPGKPSAVWQGHAVRLPLVEGEESSALVVVWDITERKMAEELLRQSEARYRLLVEQTVDGIFVADARGHYMDVNSAGAAMLGYTREEVLQLSLADILAEDELARLPGAVAAHAGGAVVRDEWRFRRKDGSLFPGEIMGRQLPDGRLQGIVRDITDRKRAEEAMRKLAQRDGFLVALADALRPLADVGEIKAAAARELGRHLRASRVAYAEVTPEGDVIVERGYADGVRDIPGRYRLDDYGPALLAELRAGRNIVVSDVANTPGYTEQEKARYVAVQVAANLNIPLFKDGRLVALLAVHQASPRQWAEEEVLLVQEAVERTWATVERARAEQALLASYNELERFNQAMVGRELRMIELKQEVNALCAQLGQPTRYSAGPPDEPKPRA